MAYWKKPTWPSAQTTESPEEYDLVISAQKGNEVAFEALYERYNNRISRYLTRMIGDDGVGCELTQETFLKAWAALPGLRSPERFTGWLYRIATNSAHTYQQRARHMQTISWDACEHSIEPPSIAGPEAQVAETELLAIALSRVSLTYRSCLILYVIEEFSQRDIALLLKMKEASVSKYVSRGKEELRQIYARLTLEQGSTRQEGGIW